MCGIGGVVDPTETELSSVLQRMLDSMFHRGPDGEGKHFSPQFHLAFGMRRLSIIDLEGGAQPLWNEDKTICVVCNGEIYNYKELREELIRKGHRFRTHSDCEVLVHLYEDEGERLTARLRGMFAFCIFDERKSLLFMARDHFGQKPLYYTFEPDRFAFASELKALLLLPWVSKELDPNAFLDFAAWLSLPAPRTHFRKIWKLEPGCSLRVTLKEVEVRTSRFWRYDMSAEPDILTQDLAVSEVDRALTESISFHLRADVPVGVLLSSGLDSRTVLAYSQKARDGDVESFSVGFGATDSELVGAAQTARDLRSKNHQLELSASDLSRNFDRVIKLLDEPIGDPACFAVLRLCEVARQHVKVLLSGEGSDELFGGYEARYAGMIATMQRTQRLRWLAKVLPRGHIHASASRWDRLLSRAHSSPGAEAVMLRAEGLPGDVRRPRSLSRAQLQSLMKRMDDLAREVYQPQRDQLSSLLLLDVNWQLPESLLQKADKMSMGASIELRTPILDIEVAKVASRIPSSLKLPVGGPGKFVLRKVLSKMLNERIDRPKLGFPVPLRAWFAGPLREEIEGDLFASRSSVCDFIDQSLLRASWNDFIAGWDGGRIFYALWSYERWRRMIAAAPH